MEKKEPKDKKQLEQLTDEQLENVTGGAGSFTMCVNGLGYDACCEKFPNEPRCQG